MAATQARSAAVGRRRFLWAEAQKAAQEGKPELSKLLLTAARPKWPERAAQHTCEACRTLLVPGVNCSVKAVQLRAKRSHKPAARRRSMHVHCHCCGHANILPSAPRPSARAAITTSGASTSLPPHAKKKKKGVAQPLPAVKEGKKLRRIQPKAASEPKPPGQAGDALFGFDFVPLG